MIDLALLYLAVLVGIIFALRRSGLWIRSWLNPVLAATAVLMLGMYPRFFDFPLGQPCEVSASGHGSWLPPAPSYSAWRSELEANSRITVKFAEGGGRLIEPPSAPAPWWYPDTDGDEAERSGGVSFLCRAPLGLLTYSASRYRLPLGWIFRVGSVAGVSVSTREQASSVLEGLGRGIVKASVYSATERRALLVPTGGAEDLVVPSDLLHLRGPGVLYFEVGRESASLLFSIDGRPVYSVLPLLSLSASRVHSLQLGQGTEAILRGAGETELAAVGFVSGARRSLGLGTFREAVALAWRMAGLHGHGTARLVLAGTPLPAQWYLLPLLRFWQPDYLFFRLASLLLALAIARILVSLLLRATSRWWPELAVAAPTLVLILALLMTLNDTWVVAWF